MAKQLAWQYAWGHNGSWNDMSDEIAAEVEEAFLIGKKNIILSLPGQQLFIDFEGMFQKVDIERPIRRICILAGGTSAPTRPITNLEVGWCLCNG